MVDTVSKKHRSWVMSRIRSDNTKPELVMRHLLHRSGFRYSLKRKLPGKPDIILPKYKSVIFVHGCFWHWHRDPRCKISKIPKSNTPFWLNKLKNNSDRDKNKKMELEKLGWRVITVWECELLGDPEGTYLRVAELLTNSPNIDSSTSSYSNVNVKEAVTVAETRHRNILKKRTGTTRFDKNENT